MFEYIFLVVYSILLLVFITIMSFTGFTVYDAVIYSNYDDSNQKISNQIANYIYDQTSNNILIRTNNGYHFKTAKIAYDVRTDVLCLDEYTISLSDEARLAPFFLAHMKI